MMQHYTVWDPSWRKRLHEDFVAVPVSKEGVVLHFWPLFGSPFSSAIAFGSCSLIGPPLLNSYNPVQLIAWQGNVDIKLIVSRRRVLNYCTKYATKPEPCSKALKSIYSNVMKSLIFHQG